MSKLDDWGGMAPSRPVSTQKKDTVFVRTSISWTADYPSAINKLLLEAQQGTGDPSFNKSLIMRAAVRALERLDPAERLDLMRKMQEEKDSQG